MSLGYVPAFESWVDLAMKIVFTIFNWFYVAQLAEKKENEYYGMYYIFD